MASQRVLGNAKVLLTGEDEASKPEDEEETNLADLVAVERGGLGVLGGSGEKTVRRGGPLR